MRRYLLLFVMSLACITGVQAGITVAPPEASEDGSYVLTFKSEAAEGETMYNTWADLPTYVKDATSVIIKTEGNEILYTDDMTQIMGNNSASYFTQLKSLDMGDAKLDNNNDLALMSCARDGKGLNQLTYFVFPKTTTSIPVGMFNGNTIIQEIIMLEPDNETDPHLTLISAQAFQGCTSLANVRIPDGITEIQANAFQYCAFEAISLPNSLTTIGETAFGDCANLKTITIPSSVTEIGKSAFQGNTSMTDVYVIGNDVKIGDSAFDHNLTQNEFKYDGSLDGDPNTVTIVDWKSTTGANVGQIPLRLHIPNNLTALEHYMNPNLRFLNALNDPIMVKQALEKVKGEGVTVSDEDVSTQIDNISKYYSERWFDNMSSHEDAEQTQNVINQLKELCNAKNIYSNDDVMPTNWETMDDWRHFHTASGKFNFGPDQPGAQENPDYAGWWNFMFVAGDLGDVIWPDDRMVDSRWYSAVFPFNMSYDQLIAAYGNGTDVREFTYVNEHTVNGKKKRTVTFNTERNTTKQGRRIIYRGTGESYIEKGVPYMIHPGVRSYNNEGQPVGRTIAGVNVKEAQGIVNANTDLEPVPGNLVDGDNGYSVLTEGAYIFKGSYQKCTLPANTFYLGYDPNPEHYYPLAFYVTKADITNGWTAFTSVVQKTGGGDPALAKGTMDFDFIELPIIKEDFGITTRIESVATKTGRMELQKVYNLSGQVVRENNVSLEGLSKGVYVVNGKKIVVR